MPEIDSNNRKIVIYDDETNRARDVWKPKILEMGVDDLTVDVPTCEEIQLQLDQLHDRRIKADKGEEPFGLECDLDDYDVLVVDYDLRELGDHKGFATGEEVAYSARMFSKVKIIVVVNHPDIGLNDFDLNLQRDRNLKADIYIGHKQIANPGLWCGSPGHDGFLPWSWSALLEDITLFDQCLKQITDNWTKEILPFFGFDKAETRLSSEMLAFLGMPKSGVTFEQILSGPPEDRTRPFVRPKDLQPLLNDKERSQRVITAVIKKWLRRWVLPPQTVLADAPHLAVSLPWGLNDYRDESNWHLLTTRDITKSGEVIGLFRQEVVSVQFGLHEWIGRPTFFIQSARELIEAESEPMESFEFSNVPDILFAEDLSRFIPSGEAVEYDLSLDGQQQVRAVSDNDTVIVNTDRFDPKDVVYVPQSLLA